LLISTAASSDFHYSFLETVYYFLWAAGFILGYYIIKKREALKTLNGLFIVNLIIACFFGILYFVSQTKLEPRAYGRFFQADILAGYLVLFIPMAVILAITVKDKIQAAFYIAVSALACAVLFLTFSRGALLAMTAAAPFMAWYLFKKVKIGEALMKLGAIVVLAVIIVSFCTPQAGKSAVKNQLDKRIEETMASGSVDGSTGARLDFYMAALKITAQRPLIGSGLGTFGYHYPMFQTRVKYYSRYAHNFYLGLLSEAGIPVFLAFLVVLFFVGKTIVQRIRKIPESENFTFAVASGLAIGLIASLVHISIDVDFNFSGIAFTFWVIAGILAGLGQEESSPPERGVPERLLRMAGASGLCLLMFAPFIYNLSFDLQEKGEIYYKEDQFAKASQYYDKSVSMDPFDNEGWRKKAEIALRFNKPQEALSFINRAIRLSPWRSRNYETKGRILDILGRYDESFASYNKAIQLDPINQIYAYQAIGEYYVRKGQFREAVDAYNEGLAYYQGVNFDDLWNFRSVPLKPQVAAVYLSMGETYIRMNQYDDAIKAFEKSMGYEKNIPSVFGMGYSYYLKKDYKNAISLFLQVTASPMSIPEVHYYLSDCYLKTGDKAKSDLHKRLFDDMKRKQAQEKKSK
jgi:tetratricopeptide (TPR) repeat protein